MYYAKYSMRRGGTRWRTHRTEPAAGYTLRPQPSGIRAAHTQRTAAAMTEITDPRVNALIRRLEKRYVDAVDSRRMDAWLDCFTEDGSYYVLGADNEADGLPLCLMMDDCRERLEDRATFVDEVWPGSYEDYQTRHFIQPLRLEADESDPGVFRSLANFIVFATDARGRTGLFIAGQYRDRIRVNAEDCRYVERRVVMDTFTTPGVIVYPL